jgi:hypothetical protein
VSAGYLLCLDDDGILVDVERELVRCFRATDSRGKQAILRLAQSQCTGARG